MRSFEPTAPAETAWLIGVQRPGEPDWAARDTLAELRELARTAGVRVAGESLARLREPDAATWIGRGRAEMIGREAGTAGATLLIFDDDLAPAQARNLEDLTTLRVLDRTQLILDIFAQRAHTSEGRLQIELAQLEYLRPRLRHSRGRLEQQRGGIGLRGPGETQLEMDRRRMDRRIARIRSELEQVRARREELRRGRRRHGWALVCLVGYTNAGKSTLLNALCGAEVPADDRLFATLDPTTRRLELPNHQPALLTDTVGFIRKLPHRLIEAFQATLEETARADLLVHVVDCAHPAAESHIEAVNTVLREIGAGDRPRLLALNKIDLPGAADRARRLAHTAGPCIAISAARQEGLDELRGAIAEALRDRGIPFEIEVPAADGRALALIREHAALQSEAMNGDRIRIAGTIPPRYRWLVEPYERSEPAP